jgi:hypothetical protein
VSQVNTRVFVAFDLAAGGSGDFLTLDDQVKGELDEAAYPLAGDVLTEVTSDVRQVNIRRGRSWQLDRFQSGSSNVVLTNNDRQYDPANALQTAERFNLVRNPSFETNLGLWSTSASTLTTGGATASVSGAQIRWGSASARVETENLTPLPGFHTTVTGLSEGTTYTISGFVYWQQGFGVQLRTRETTNGVLGTTSNVITAPGWQRVASHITTGTRTPLLNVLIDDAVVPFDDTYVTFDGGWEAQPVDVEIAFVNETVGQFFTLNDLTLGLLDDSSVVLAGATSLFFVDGVLLENGAELLPYFDGNISDPQNLQPQVEWTGAANDSISRLVFRIPGTGSPYWPNVKPRKEMAIEVNNARVFTGTIEDWDFTYSVASDSTAVMHAADGFAQIATSFINPYSAPSELSGARIADIINLPEVGWLLARSIIDNGDITLSAQDIGGTADPKPVNALEYLQKVEESEFGSLYMQADNVLRFKARSSTRIESGVVFSDDGGVPFVDISLDYGVESLRNSVQITRLGGTAVVAVNDPASISAYGVAALELRDTLLNSDADATTLGNLLVDRYAEPRVRIDRISVNLRTLSASDLSDILALDLGDVVQVRFTPRQVGEPIEQTLIVDAIEHTIEPANHVVTFDLSETEPVLTA